MKKNVGSIDRVARIVVGMALLIFAFVGPEDLKVWGFIGIIPLATGLFHFCPLYTLFGLNTCPLKK
ncbi:MAG: DUF2892 domain-containing protein [Deltaproteobacteria bacterium]|nr:DUF2892 domain-containing protein [Deltaproteobacteria bacterium]